MDSSSPASSAPTSHFIKTVRLCDWWLIKSDVEHQGRRIAIGGSEFKAGSRIRKREPGRCFCSAPIVKRNSRFELETADGILVKPCGYINKSMTEQNGFSSEVFHYFVIGFPSNWEERAEECLEKGPAVEDSAPELTNVKHMGNLTSSSKEDCSSAEDIRQGIMYDGHVYSDPNSGLQDKGVHENIFSFDHRMPSPVASPACSNMPNVNDNSLGAPLLRQSGKDACNLTGERLVVMESHIQDAASEGKNFRSNSIHDGNERIPDVAHHAALANLETSFDDTTQSIPDAYQPTENLTTDIGGHNPKKLKPRKSDGNSMSLSSKKHNSNASVILPDDDKKMLHRCISEATDVPKGNRESSVEVLRRSTRSSTRKVSLSQKDGSNIAAETVLCHSTQCKLRKSKSSKQDNGSIGAKRENNAKDLETSQKDERNIAAETVLRRSTRRSSKKSMPRKKENGGIAAKRDRENNAKDLDASPKHESNIASETVLFHSTRGSPRKSKPRKKDNGGIAAKRENNAKDLDASPKQESNIAAETVLFHSTRCSSRKSKPRKKDNGSIAAKRENKAKDLETSKQIDRKLDFGSPDPCLLSATP